MFGIPRQGGVRLCSQYCLQLLQAPLDHTRLAGCKVSNAFFLWLVKMLALAWSVLRFYHGGRRSMH